MTDSPGNIPETDLREKFITEFKALGGKVKNGDGSDLIISLKDHELTVSLEQLQKEYDRTGSLSGYEHFMSAVLSEAGIIPAWDDVREAVFPVFYSTALNPGDVVSDDMTDEFRCAYFYEISDRREWIGRKHLDAWHIDEDMLRETAVANLDRCLGPSEISVETDEETGLQIGFIDTDFFYPSSFLIAPGLPLKLIRSGFPLPVFIYMPTAGIFEIIRDCDIDDAVTVYGNSILSEFLSDPHPVTPEIFVIDEDGIHAAGYLDRNGDNAEFIGYRSSGHFPA
ncbi:hypothetical protein J5839_00555 [Methanosarcinaceae archaeon]|nr:hypothetical protein [Methanosarcinaceae archaeon]MBQ3620415.1 hypothetical protein [Methanosarcinaceae archaeon]